MEQAQPDQSPTRSRARAERRAQRSQRPTVVTPGLPGGQYKPLSQRDIERIHEASLTVLERAGIEVMPSECRELLRAAGAKVDDGANRVFLPRQMVAQALTLAPKEVRLCGRDPNHDLVLGVTRVYMGTGGAAVKVLDLATGAARESTLQDVTDAKMPDIQAGYEKGITGTMAALAGSNYIHHAAGFLESLLTVAYEQYVIDDDINGSILRALRGIEVTEETLSVDVIDAVCKDEGHFLGSAQSLALMNSEYYYPHTADRRSRAAWEEAGALDMREVARQKARTILATHQPKPIPAVVDAAIRARWPIMLPPLVATET